jgi:SpoVK/Ycf46/Vps4 family AAA+-type ATPase
MSDARRLVRNAIYHDGAITEDDLPAVMKAKYELLGQGGILSFEYETAQFAEVGGFKKLITWINHRKVAFLQGKETALDMPKGIMLLGVQGSGKSLAAKAVAGAWEVPLLRMDFGALYNKFFGETEKNIRDSLKAAEVMSPCVLWMDEIEKGVATGDYDSGTSRRVLASMLTWMAENKKPVFIVATANDIESLPPELIRKGRLDEIFFVDLPDQNTRAEIFAIHLSKRGQQPPNFDLQRLAVESDGFSGAEIEQAVVAALYAAHARETTITTQHIFEEIKATQPLSVVMAEKIRSLQQWAQGRTVAAN